MGLACGLVASTGRATGCVVQVLFRLQGFKRLREGPDKERSMYCQRMQIFVDEAHSLVILPVHDPFQNDDTTLLCYSDGFFEKCDFSDFILRNISFFRIYSKSASNIYI